MAAAVWTACTRLLFWQKKVGAPERAVFSGAFAVLWAFLRGVLEKTVYRMWFFDGENVVEWCFNVV
jgi:hypothetical protein